MAVRAGIVVTGTEVLGGLVADRNGPWLSERLRERGLQVGHILVCGDRPADVRAALDFLAGQGVALVVTSGGLGPTADDLTAEVVAEFAGRPLRFDPALEERVWAIVSRLRRPGGGFDATRMREGSRKQALVPEGATVLEPVGTAPGLVVPPRAQGGPVVLVLPGPPGELQAMWEPALATPLLSAITAQAGPYEQRMLRLLGVPEPVIAATLRELEAEGMPLARLEITTCLRRGELEIATVFAPPAAAEYEAFARAIRERHGKELFSEDGATVDEQVARLLGDAGLTVAVAESCTGGLMAGRLTERTGSSAYVLGGLVVYSNEAKVALAAVPEGLIERHGAVSPEVAAALADGARDRLGADFGIGITGIAGPDGGTPEKPVGTVCLSVAGPGAREDRTVHLPGGRAHVRDRTTTLALHMLRRLLIAR
jgi:nicotinamide-nucleotide amidase